MSALAWIARREIWLATHLGALGDWWQAAAARRLRRWEGGS